MTTVSPPVKSGDPESLLVSPKKSRCLDHCLVISVVLLTLAVGSMFAFYLFWERPLLEYRVAEHTDGQRSNAHLITKNVLLENVTLKWDTQGVGNVFVGSDFHHDSGDVVVGRTGLYYVYSQMVLDCVGMMTNCLKNGVATLSIMKESGSDKTPILTLNVQLNNDFKTSPPSTFSGTVQLLFAGDRLSAKLWTDRPHLEWQLSQKENSATFLGLFLITESNSLPTEQ